MIFKTIKITKIEKIHIMVKKKKKRSNSFLFNFDQLFFGLELVKNRTNSILAINRKNSIFAKNGQK